MLTVKIWCITCICKYVHLIYYYGTLNSKINGTPKGFYLPFSKLHSILAVANLLAPNNITISYYVQVNSLWLKSSKTSKWARKKL